MNDDFQDPDDSCYGYDSYGDGKALTLELLRPAMTKYNLAAYFPSARSDQETGARRGSVVFTRGGEFSEKLSRLKSLRQGRGTVGRLLAGFFKDEREVPHIAEVEKEGERGDAPPGR